MIGVSQIAPFGVRMPAEMKDWLKSRANQNKRSANSELVAILEEIQKRENEKAPTALTVEAPKAVYSYKENTK